jgi:hypothetical protein
MKCGIYITANNRFIDEAIALLNSIRLYDRETPVMLIPYDDNYHKVAEVLTEKYGVKIYPDLAFIERLSLRLQDTFGSKFFARPNQFRKQACWFGEFDRFLYIDTDIVVFDKIIDTLNYLDRYNFVCYDYQHKGGIKNVFTQEVITQKVFTETELLDVFNCGFWGSKKNLISEELLYETFQKCAQHPEYFDFSQKTSDQPIINYMILERVKKRFNIVKKEGGAPGNWGGSTHFERRGDILFDTKVNQPLQFIHWAGIKIKPGCPYWDIWKHYRYLNDPNPPADPPPEKLPTLIQKFKNKLKTLNIY